METTQEIKGYGCVASWDGQTFRAKGTNKFAHRALMGYNPDSYTDEELNEMGGREKLQAVKKIAPELVLNRDSFRAEKFRRGNMARNGLLVLRDNDGFKYQLHFRNKQYDAFAELEASLPH